MIPKIILQVSDKPLETEKQKYILELLQDKCEGWEYNHFTLTQMLSYIVDNELDEFPLAMEKFKVITNKCDFFRYYFLYINGGFHINSNTKIHTKMEDIIKNYEFVSVVSCMREKSLFQGLVGAVAKSPVIYNMLKFMYDTDAEIMDKNDNLLGDKLYEFASLNGDDKSNEDDKSNIVFYTESTDESKNFASTYNTKVSPKQKLFTHYFAAKSIPKLVVKPESIAKTKIGISFSFPKDAMGIFSNGIRQNVIFLYDLLVNIGYDVYLIIDNADIDKCGETNFWNKGENKAKYKYVAIGQLIHSNFHIVMQVGRELEMHILEFLQDCGVKTVYYCCGNKYFIEAEQCLFRRQDNADAYFQYNNSTYFHFSQVWLIPQHINSCTHYLKAFYRAPIVNVPFIWSHSILDEYEKELGKTCQYVNRGPNKSVAIFEPNLSTIKWCLPGVLVCENTQRSLKNKALLNYVYITNINNGSSDGLDTKIFNNMVKSLDIYKAKKLSIESRYNSLFFMSKHSDIAVSHQMENNLNYLYLDLAWMGWPVVHNANLCSDVGYYYDGFNYEEGGEKLKYAILNHDENVDTYTKKNREIIDRYLPTNKKLQEDYKQLVANLLSM